MTEQQPVNPPSERPWQWWTSTDEERYNGPYDSRDEAISEALGQYAFKEIEKEDGSWVVTFHVVEATQLRAGPGRRCLTPMETDCSLTSRMTSSRSCPSPLLLRFMLGPPTSN